VRRGQREGEDVDRVERERGAGLPFEIVQARDSRPRLRALIREARDPMTPVLDTVRSLIDCGPAFTIGRSGDPVGLPVYRKVHTSTPARTRQGIPTV
jgi:hypothetical protein